MHRIRRRPDQQRRAVQRHRRTMDAYAFFDLLTDEPMLDAVDAQLPRHRERLFPPTETLALFMAQALSADRSCQHAVDGFVARRVAGGLSACSTATGAYCRARQRLPQSLVAALIRFTGHRLTSQAHTAGYWRERPIRLVDGTTVVMPDTPANQHAFPQPTTQKPGLGFPMCRLVALSCLASGAVLAVATAPYPGKGNDEQSLLRTLLDHIEPGSIMLGDAFFATYFLLAELQRRGVDGVFAQHGSRKRRTDFRTGRRLGVRDHVIDLHKPATRPAWMTPEHYGQVPDRLAVREVQVGGKVLVTTLLCAQQTAKHEVKALYRQRWHIELDLRCLKTTLGMEMLSCRSPDMAMTELRVYLLAYNLIRGLMLRTAIANGTCVRKLSFKHTVQLWLAWRQCHPPDVAWPDGAPLLALIAQRCVGQRPGRIEPRVRKRRPKLYPLLTQPRALARETVRANGHPRKVK